ncbi:MAG: thioredoxin family protein [Bacteroidia bacterium]|nr:thioredoxin family protein [Bacteroidia bacterium]MDW8157592.1 thioredoxin family protein [Bacteroidia bacterium]
MMNRYNNNKALSVFWFLVMSLFYFPVQGQGIKFVEGSWNQVLELARRENKFIFVDAYAEWCGPCKWMVANTFKDPQVGEFFNKNFISYKMDMEKGEGPEFARKHQVRFYPTYLFFDPAGNLVHRSGGAKEGPKFIEDAKDALDPNKQFYGYYVRNYVNNNRTPDFLYNFAFAIKKAGEEPGPIVEEYLKTQTESDLFSLKNWEFITNMVNSSNNPTFEFVLKNLSKYYQKYDPVKVDDYISKVFNAEATAAAQKNERAKIAEIRNKILELEPKSMQKMLAQIDYTFNTYLGGIDQFYTAALNYAPYIQNNAEELMNAAWGVMQRFEDKEKLEKALEWSKRAIELDPYNATIHYVHAYVQFKQQKYKEAKETMDYCLRLTKQKTANIPTEYTELMNKIQEKLK